MTDFYFPPEFDDKYSDATDGVWFDIDDRAGNHLGKFKCALIHEENPKVQLYNQRMRRARKAGKELTEDEQVEAMKTIFLQCSLLDWDLKDAKKKPIPFDSGTAAAYFGTKRGQRVMADLFTLATNYDHYQPDEIEPEKN